jgi:hypothetical protein
MLHMCSEKPQDFGFFPPLGYRSIGSFEGSNCLGPFAWSGRLDGLSCAGCWNCAFGRLQGGGHGILCRPIVDVPVVLVEEKIILLQLFGRHSRKMDIGKVGQKEITF